MARRLSRRTLAMHLAGVIEQEGDLKQAVKQLAAYLIDTHRTAEVDLIVRDIEVLLAEKGTVVGTVVSAFELTSATQQAIEQLVKEQTQAQEVVLSYQQEPAVIGGYKITTPGRALDRTMQHHLTTLKTRFKKV